MKILINYFLTFFRKIYFFEGKKNKKKIYFKNLKLKSYNSLKSIDSPLILNYLKKEKRFKRFKKKQILYVLIHKKETAGFGWMFRGDYWKIAEIDRIIKIKNANFLFDFIIIRKFRNMQFYKKFLILLRNINTNNFFYIYSLSSNIFSRRGIMNSGFKFKFKIMKIF